MGRRIVLQGKDYEVEVLGKPGAWKVGIDGQAPFPASLDQDETRKARVRFGKEEAACHLAAEGETIHIRAFGRTFSLQVLDPVEQAAQERGGRADTAKAPMPGVVVEVKVAEGEPVKQGQPVMTIESMKILTVIAAPRDGRVAQVHFGPGASFDKNATLITLAPAEET